MADSAAATTPLGAWLATLLDIPESEVEALVARRGVTLDGEAAGDAGVVPEAGARVGLVFEREWVEGSRMDIGKRRGTSVDVDADADADADGALDEVHWPVTVELGYPDAVGVDACTHALNLVSLSDQVHAYEYPEYIKTLPHGLDAEHNSQDEMCAVCMDPVVEDEHIESAGGKAIVRLAPCAYKHFFHRECIGQWIAHGAQKCPVCGAICGVLIGNMPGGSFSVHHYEEGEMSLADHNGRVIEISYSFPNGTQTDAHYHPGNPYYGTYRTAYLPDTPEGRQVLGLLRLAFVRRVMFTVGTSVTTGCEDCVVWAGIHAKTNTHGGASSFGYPDPTYFARVKAELADRGIYPEDLEFIPEEDFFKPVELETV